MIPNIHNGRIIAATPRILPAVYDDALTYIEQVRILNNKLNEVIDVFNEYGTTMLDQSKEYTDQEIEKFRVFFLAENEKIKEEVANGLADLDEQLKNALEEFEEDAEAEFQWFRQRADELFELFVEETTKLNENINRLQIAVNTLFDALARTKEEMRNELKREIEKIMVWLEQAVAAKTGQSIIVMNPVLRQYTNLNIALESLANVTKIMFSLTANEYKPLNITADQYKELNITAADYLYKARWIFFKDIYFPDLDERFEQIYDYINAEVEALVKNHYMISPFNGVVTPISRVVYRLAQLHMHGITADQYKVALLTADAYKALNVTAHDYAWNGYYVINTGAIPPKTLEEQIAQLQTELASLTNRVLKLENDATESTTIAQMKADITANANKIETVNTDLGNHILAQDKKNNQIDGEIAIIKDDMQYVNDTAIPDAIDGLHSTLNTQIAGVQSQVTAIDSGLKKIHITY